MTNEADIAERLEQIAFPGMTANFDVGKTAALAVTLNEWLADGAEHAQAMVDCAHRLAAELSERGVPLHHAGGQATVSHAFAIDARATGGGMAAAHKLRSANLLASAIGLPGDDDGGVRVGTNELVRIGATSDHMPELSDLIAAAWTSDDPFGVTDDVRRFRSMFSGVHFTGEG
jgi:glycine hydroxymethyltransferase